MRRLLPFALLLCLPVFGQDDPEAARKKLKLAPGVDAVLWASTPQVMNPVAISPDEQGRIYVAECFRRHTSTLDIHMRKEWLDDDLACRTHEDQIAYHRKRMGEKLKEWTVESERIRIVQDKGGTGRADSVVTFSDGYRDACEGIGAGVLVRNGEVWYTCIPNLWHLKDTDGDGVADAKKALYSGFGVHLGASGHDMHGLRFGPDGKLYWSHGDRGFHVEAEGKTVSFPDGGGVLRCNPDGSELELFCQGLRNPQELQFDAYGNLFTGDNNISISPDVGETCRWTYVVEGADYGWRIGYQFMPKGGAWCAEEQWKAEAGFQVPFVARLGHGPSGVTVHPGVAALPERYRGCFFMCDYPGGIYSFRMKPKGASFEMVDLDKLLWDIQTPDAEFGPDGALYVADWVGMWDKVDQGRIWKLAATDRLSDPAVLEVKRLIGEGMKGRAVEELATLLNHADQRVRQAAQFELAGRKEIGALTQATDRGRPEMTRIHAIWALGQLKAKDRLLPLLDDASAEIRAQAAKTLGGLKTALAYERFVALLKDPSPRVRFFAALGLGKIGKRDAVDAVIEFLAANAGEDRMLQHAGTMALAGLDDLESLLKARKSASSAVRMASLVAMRKLGRSEAALFLEDADPKIVLEAARAIYDTPIPDAFPALARLTRGPERARIRAMNAAFRLGQAELLVQAAADPEQIPAVRIEALQILGDWERPSGRDRLMGLWRPIDARPREEVLQPFEARVREILKTAPPAVAAEAARLGAVLKIEGLAAEVRGIFRDPKQGPEARADALAVLGELKDPGLAEDVKLALEDPAEPVLREAVRRLSQVRFPDGAERLRKIVDGKGSIGLRQDALASLGAIGAADVLGRLLDRGVPPALQLDLEEAAAKQPELKKEAAEYSRKWSTDARLEGGDAEAGRAIFFERGDVQCVRCHTVGDSGGQVGPPLTKIGGQKTREYLLESILTPNQQIAEGWGQTALQLDNDSVEVGRVEKESDAELTLVLGDGSKKTLQKSAIKARKAALSAMPEDAGKRLSRRDLRNLVEFLAGLK